MGLTGKSVLVSLIALWCFTSSAFSEELNHVTQSPAPSPYHHGHHHPHPHPPAKSPVKPPTKSPVSPPAKSPVKPPVYPPTKAPVKPPTKPPVKPPVSPPAKPPVKPPVNPPKFNRTLVAIEGGVRCKNCRYIQFDTLMDSKPVKGAVVRLVCKSFGKIVALAEATTDKNGYFLLLGPKTVTNFGFKGCRVSLVKSKNGNCNKISNFNDGDVGAGIMPETTPEKSKLIINNLIYSLFKVGPFAFDPKCPK